MKRLLILMLLGGAALGLSGCSIATLPRVTFTPELTARVCRRQGQAGHGEAAGCALPQRLGGTTEYPRK